MCLPGKCPLLPRTLAKLSVKRPHEYLRPQHFPLLTTYLLIYQTYWIYLHSLNISQAKLCVSRTQKYVATTQFLSHNLFAIYSNKLQSSIQSSHPMLSSEMTCCRPYKRVKSTFSLPQLFLVKSSRLQKMQQIGSCWFYQISWLADLAKCELIWPRYAPLQIDPDSAAQISPIFAANLANSRWHKSNGCILELAFNWHILGLLGMCRFCWFGQFVWRSILGWQIWAIWGIRGGARRGWGGGNKLQVTQKRSNAVSS